MIEFLALFLESVFFRTDESTAEEPRLTIECNYCSRPGSVFYEGGEGPSPDKYLDAVIAHLRAEHPEDLRAMEHRLVQ